MSRFVVAGHSHGLLRQNIAGAGSRGAATQSWPLTSAELPIRGCYQCARLDRILATRSFTAHVSNQSLQFQLPALRPPASATGVQTRSLASLPGVQANTAINNRPLYHTAAHLHTCALAHFTQNSVNCQIEAVDIRPRLRQSSSCLTTGRGRKLPLRVA
jgi:hypothetical protein